jgi:hypothetical protein
MAVTKPLSPLRIITLLDVEDTAETEWSTAVAVGTAWLAAATVTEPHQYSVLKELNWRSALSDLDPAEDVWGKQCFFPAEDLALGSIPI